MKTTEELSKSLVRIHLLITRGIETAQSEIDEIREKGYTKPKTKEGFLKFLRSLTTVFHAHHLTEDEVVFPFFEQRKLDAPFDEWRMEHIKISSAVKSVSQLISDIENKNVPEEELLTKGHDLLNQLKDLWYPHFQSEEYYFQPSTIDLVTTREEIINIGKDIGKHSKELSQPGTVIIPFMLYNLELEDRKIFSKEFPWIINFIMVPGFWKSQWRSMEPYLLP